jgi:hypothetical protein
MKKTEPVAKSGSGPFDVMVSVGMVCCIRLSLLYRDGACHPAR